MTETEDDSFSKLSYKELPVIFYEQYKKDNHRVTWRPLELLELSLRLLCNP